MNLVPAGMTRGFATSMFKAKQNSPHIFFGLGVVGLIGSTVLACRATMKLEETIDEIKSNVDEVAHSSSVAVEKSDADHAKEMGLVTIKGAVELSKLYGPAVIVGGVSVVLLTGSHVQLTRRNAALTAAFTALTKAYDDYRARVRIAVGEDRELDLYRGVEEITEIDDNGKKHKIRVVDPDGRSPYAVSFGPKCPEWKPNAEFNRTFIQLQERYANHRLTRDGFVILNDVYVSLGLPRTPAGAIVGWVKNSKEGDNYIDFGLFDARTRQDIHADDPNLYLDFNVDGVVYQQISE